MGLIRYTHDQLLKLRDSPLVRKPDGLPSIAQYIEEQNDLKDRQKARQLSGRNDDQAVGEGFSQRNNPFQTTRMGKGALGPDDFGKFATPRHQNRAYDSSDKPPTPGEEGGGRGRWQRDRAATREKDTLTTGLDADKDDGEGWQSVRAGKSFGAEEGERWRNGDRNRDRFQRNAEGDPESRRNGTGRSRLDKTWHREDAGSKTGELEPRTGGRTGGWRDRERRDDRWTRGGRLDDKAEEDPEWMDDTPKDEPAQGRSAADMERFKQMMKDRAAGGTTKADVGSPSEQQKDSPTDSKLTTPLTAVDSGRLFAMWTEKKPETGGTNGTGTFKATAKAKGSRFMDFFDSQKGNEGPEAAEPPTPASPPPRNESTDADKAGFDRVLAMLQLSSVSSPPQASPSAPPLLQNRTPIEVHSPEAHIHDMRRPPEPHDDRAFFEQFVHQAPAPPPNNRPHLQDILAQQEQFGTSPDHDFGPFTRGRIDNMPSRNGAKSGKDAGGPFSPPEHLATMDSNHAFLLNLMQSRATPPRQELMSPPSDLNANFVFPENKALKATHPHPQQQKMRGPPGIYDDRQLYEIELQQREQQQRQRELENMPELGRKQSQRGAGPPGFFEDPAIASLQRRNTNEATQRAQQQQHMTNMGIPRQMPPQQEDFFMKAQPPPGMRPPNMQDNNGMPQAMRYPPGFGMPPPPPGPPNMQHSVGNTSLGHPGMQPQRGGPGGPHGMPGMFPPGMPPPPAGPPQGYFGGPGGPPPGFMGPPGGMGMPPSQQGRGRAPFDMLAEMGMQGRGPGNAGRGGMPF